MKAALRAGTLRNCKLKRRYDDDVMRTDDDNMRADDDLIADDDLKTVCHFLSIHMKSCSQILS